MSGHIDRVLIVDDDLNLQKVLVRSLQRLGYQVDVAGNGADGLRKVLESPPHVILTDIRMPEVDGHAFLRELMTQDVDSAVVVMSGHGNMQDVVDVLRNGAVDYLSKPWTPSELAASMARAAEINAKRRMFREASAQLAAAKLTAGLGSGATDTSAGEPAAPASADDAIFAAVLEQLRRGDIELPSIAPVVAELRALARDPRSSLDDVAAVVERDPRTAAQVLRLSNSAQYARNGRSNDARTAVKRVGMAQVKGIAETIHAHACHEVREPHLRELQKQVWRYSVARAISMRALVDLSLNGEAQDPEIAYCAGLMADSGASYLIWLAAERCAGQPATPLQREACLRAVRGQHTEVGGMLLTRWGMDPAVIFIATHHHDSAPPAPPHPYWRASVLASELAGTLVPSGDLTCDGAIDRNLVDRCASELGIGAALLDRLKSRLEPELATILETLQ